MHGGTSYLSKYSWATIDHDFQLTFFNTSVRNTLVGWIAIKKVLETLAQKTGC